MAIDLRLAKKTYFFSRAYGASRNKARKMLAATYGPLGKRQLGRLIRKVEREFNAPTMRSGYRSYEEQRRLYEQWNAGRSPLFAVPGHSIHDFGHGRMTNA